VKSHYNRIKQNALTFMVTMATVAILKNLNPKFTTTHPKNIPIFQIIIIIITINIIIISFCNM
jgi:negative regulator of sigma E activity